MDLYSLEMGKAGLAAEQKQQAQQQMMSGIGNLVSAGISGYSSGAFGGGTPSASNLAMAPGSTLPGNTLDSSYMSPTYGANPAFSEIYNFGPQDLQIPYGPENGTEINVGGGFPSYNL